MALAWGLERESVELKKRRKRRVATLLFSMLVIRGCYRRSNGLIQYLCNGQWRRGWGCNDAEPKSQMPTGEMQCNPDPRIAGFLGSIRRTPILPEADEPPGLLALRGRRAADQGRKEKRPRAGHQGEDAEHSHKSESRSHSLCQGCTLIRWWRSKGVWVGD